MNSFLELLRTKNTVGRQVFLVLLILATTVLLSTCNSDSNPSDTTDTSDQESTSTSTLNSTTDTTIPAETDSLSFLPDPQNWAASLHIDSKDYPRVDGSTATLPLGIYMRAKLTGETLEQSETFTLFTRTNNAWLDIAYGEADLLIVYEAAEETKRSIDESGTELKIAPIGRDALVFLANAGNPVDNLSHQQIVDIYTDKITNWKEVGGTDTPIVAHQRPDTSGSQALMEKLVMQGTSLSAAPSVQKPSEMGELIDSVAEYNNEANALGYSVYYYVKNMYQVPSIKLLSVDSIAPTDEMIAQQKYPYTNDFYVVIRANEPADSPAHKIFDWLTGREGDKAIVDAGYVPVAK